MYFILINSTTADASDVNDNFYHIAQGSRLPMGGQSLSSTDGVYDLGSDSYRWNTLYCNNIDFDGTANGNLWVKVHEETVENVSDLEITGLNGDTDEMYLLYAYATDDPAHTHVMTFNGDSTSNKGLQNLKVIGGSASGTAQANRSVFDFLGVQSSGLTTTVVGFSKSIIYAKTGAERTLFTQYGSASGDSVGNGFTSLFQCWADATTTITSIKLGIFSNTFTSLHVILFKKA